MTSTDSSPRPVRESHILEVLGRDRSLFAEALSEIESELAERVREGSFLVLGGAGSIGQPICRGLFKRQPRRLHVVDLSENNLVELVRDVRSSYGYIDGDFQTLPLDCASPEFARFFDSEPAYSTVLNLTALKHVRSEKDAFTLMRMVQTNVLNTASTLELAIGAGSRRYFSVSSDKAANPANAMGATKRVMELCLIAAADRIEVGSARFANVAFSDGSLLHGFTERLAKRQPLSAPEDVRRYFITPEEAGTLTLAAALMGDNLDCFFPDPDSDFEPQSFREIAERFLRARGLEAYPCATEDEARSRVEELAPQGRWPCYFFSSDTTGEKEVEEFCMESEELAPARYREIGVVRWQRRGDGTDLERFLASMRAKRESGEWTREQILGELKALVPELRHQETGKFLDARM